MGGTVHLSTETIRAIAEEVADLLVDRHPSRFLSVAEVAEKFSISTDYLYRHADELGAIRLGNRLRFDAERVVEALSPEPFRTPPAKSAPPKRSRSSVATDLLPIGRKR